MNTINYAEMAADLKKTHKMFEAAAAAVHAAKGGHQRGSVVRYDFKGWEIIAHAGYVECKAPLSMYERGDAALMALNSIERQTEDASHTAESLLAACQRMEDRISRAVEKWGEA